MPLRFEPTTARTALTPARGYLSGTGSGFTHSFNPAIGCAYAAGGCGAYCYARGFAERLGGRGTWGARVLLKENAPQLLERELTVAASRPADHPAHISRLSVFSASTTDPCAGPVRELYRACLRVVARHPVRRWVIQTRSPGVVALRPEIEALGSAAVISFTIESDDDATGDSPSGSPSVRARRRALERMADWPVRRHVAVSPCLPLRDPPAFAAWIASLADDATVDTFVSGDGSGGRRTAGSPFAVLADRAGADWRDESHARALLRALEREMPGRVGWSADGFLRLA